MNSFYIYSIFLDESPVKSIVVLFCPEETIDELTLKNELKKYFQKNILPDELIVIGGQYMEGDLRNYFIDNAKKNIYQYKQGSSTRFIEIYYSFFF